MYIYSSLFGSSLQSISVWFSRDKNIEPIKENQIKRKTMQSEISNKELE